MQETRISFFVRAMLVTAVIAFMSNYKILAQQKVQFTQYMFNGLVINPAYAGADGSLNLTFMQRSQWSGTPNAPTTQTLSAHTLFKKKHIGLGLSLVNDRIGVHENLHAVTSYAYHLKVSSDAYLSLGLQAGVHRTQSDYASLVGTSSNDPKLFNPFISQTFFDFGMGLYFRSPRLHLGLSAPELLPAKYNINDTLSIQFNRANYFLFSKYSVRVQENVEAEPGFLLKYMRGVPLSFDLNINLIFHRVLTTGISYRKSESIDFLLKGQITHQLQFGYSYDYPIGKVSNLSNGSHELMINYLFRYVKTNVTSPR